MALWICAESVDSMSLINKAVHLKGITVTLHTEAESGKDELNRTIYTPSEVEVENVLVGSPSEQEITDVLNLTGRKCIYVLGIPKGDTNDWTDKEVTFFGETFRTIGSPVQGIDAMIPMEWNRKVRCEKING